MKNWNARMVPARFTIAVFIFITLKYKFDKRSIIQAIAFQLLTEVAKIQTCYIPKY